MKAKVKEEVFRRIYAKYPGMTIDDIDWDVINLVWHTRDAEVAEIKKEIATNIGQMLCVLAGNLTMEDKDAGYLFACQLQPIMDYLKTKYLPDLPRAATVETIINQQVAEAEARGIQKTIRDFKQYETYFINEEVRKAGTYTTLVIPGYAWQAFLKSLEKTVKKEGNCDHEYEPTFQGGDTYKCKSCGKEIDMTED